MVKKELGEAQPELNSKKPVWFGIQLTEGQAADISYGRKLPFFVTENLWNEARTRGILRQMLADRKYKFDKIDLKINLAIAMFYYEEGIPMSRVGKAFNFSVYGASIRRDAVYREIIERLPEQLRYQYRFEELSLGRPRSLRTRIKHSAAQDGVLGEAVKGVVKKRPAADLYHDLNKTPGKMAEIRKQLKPFGINVPHKNRGYDNKPVILSAAEKKDLSYKQATESLGLVTKSILKANDGLGGVVITLRESVEDAGFVFNGRTAHKFAQALIDAQVPMGVYSQQRRILFRRHMADAKKAFNNSPELAKYKKQVSESS